MGKYELQVEIGVTSTLDAEIKKLERLQQLKEALKESVETVSDTDLKMLSEFIVKQDKINAQLKQQEAIVAKAEATMAEANARRDAAATKSLLNESKITREIQRRGAEAEKAAQKTAKAQAAENSAYQELSKRLDKAKRDVKDLLASKKTLNDTDRDLIKSTQELDQHLKEIDATVGDHRRNVGGYREALNDVTAEMGAFGGAVTRIARTLKELQEQQTHTTTTSQKLGNILKAVGIGIGLALIAAIAAANEAANKLSETLQANSDKFDINNIVTEKGREILLAWTKAHEEGQGTLEQARAALTALVDITIQYNNQLRQSKIDLANLSIEQDEFNQIANDTTIGYKERIAAQEKSLELSSEIAKKNREIAQTELDLAEANLQANIKLVGKNSTPEFKNAVAEAQIKLNEAIGQETLVKLENAAKTRDIHADQALQEIDLILKKRESANAQKAILESELKDQKLQLEQRVKIGDQLQKYNEKTTAKELDIFKKGFKVKFDSNELLKTQDAQALAQKIQNLKTLEGHNLGEKGVTELSKIVKDAQENDIANTKTQKEQKEELIKRLQKIADLEQQIATLRLQDKVGDTQKLLDRYTKAYEKNNEDILKDGKLFNSHLAKQRQSNFDFILANIEAERVAKEDLLTQEAEAEKERINNSVDDAQIRAEEIKKINAKLAIDIGNIEDEAFDKEKELNAKKEEEDKKIAKARIESIVKQTDFLVGKINEALDKRSEKNLAAIEQDQKLQDEAQQLQLSRAERGLTNELELQQKKAADLEKQKIEQQKKDKKREKELAFYNLLSGFAKEDPDTALQKAALAIAESEVISVLFAAKGGIAGEVQERATLAAGTLSRTHGASGDVVVAMSPKEGILNETQMSNLGRDGFYNLQNMLNNPIHDEVMFERVPSFMPMGAHVDDRIVEKIGEKFKDAVREIPIHNSRIDNAGNVINETIDRGMKRVVKVMSNRPGFTRG